jgi:hypothetical protein
MPFLLNAFTGTLWTTTGKGLNHGKKRAGLKLESSGRVLPLTISSAAIAPKTGDSVAPLWVTMT